MAWYRTTSPKSRMPKRPSKSALRANADAQAPLDRAVAMPKRRAQRTGPMQRPEEALQRAVIHAFQYILPPQVIFWHTPNQRANAAMRQILKALGVRSGVYDIVLVWPHRNFGVIELKVGSGGLQDTQVEFGKAIAACGFPIATCWSIEDVVAALRRFECPMTAHSWAGLGELA